ncbi:hypothetical protein AA0312_2278 [Acetobacter tropicalis NRIC 0312]|uniref:Uncharacterized protein n=2 Tax=Acetobacter tropicalis TaxID=104102 RepID=A0A511FMK8_9PROT|nr:hypothetical protein ATR1_068c0035 [Acetobacter tropicalis]GBR71363.1 hypothetical protein AA0312_2278 [Acetobacter tropicalis NRIC 0312]GEL50077.1 hypothetical protein ATR01nite_11520 [Acetobacter tropicalis]
MEAGAATICPAEASRQEPAMRSIRKRERKCKNPFLRRAEKRVARMSCVKRQPEEAGDGMDQP